MPSVETTTLRRMLFGRLAEQALDDHAIPPRRHPACRAGDRCRLHGNRLSPSARGWPCSRGRCATAISRTRPPPRLRAAPSSRRGPRPRRGGDARHRPRIPRRRRSTGGRDRRRWRRRPRPPSPLRPPRSDAGRRTRPRSAARFSARSRRCRCDRRCPRCRSAAIAAASAGDAARAVSVMRDLARAHTSRASGARCARPRA